GLARVCCEYIWNKDPGGLKSQSIYQYELEQTVRVVDGQLRGDPAAYARSHHVCLLQFQQIEQIGIMESQIMNGIQALKIFCGCESGILESVNPEVAAQVIN